MNIELSPNRLVDFIVFYAITSCFMQLHQVSITPLLEDMVYGSVNRPTNHRVKNTLLRHGDGASSTSS